ncbi:hypothetical protein UFOVP1284_19 [uncultured Caudovirales phage]|uniref:Uncharacterized protein n=1 Tax=uncultured Caudovirales phage TaxID=2100421 RepID=A0A6J7X7Q6_9CAUD|nr:hypothetical protein UFOVP1062_16 [uncultured Caudovirales phage]CAB4194785.1 hypothetical protein UFOVP1284_19 [uncultured Caudovirales phage]CAB4205016.1 hypothetical protein UFOVP1404_7 [uncultured Caudovirales phage]CAB5226710.1 hypothetical protein UFOVP1512_10 [uncultured Caudovirales phage]
MASTSTYLSNAVVTINAVDMTGECSSANLTRTFDALESTNMSNTARTFVGGLENSSLVVDLYNSYVAASTYATLKSLVGTAVIVKIKPTSAATSATNPEHTLTGAFMGTLPLVVSSLGALDVCGGITFQGGVYSVATS